MRLNGIEKKCTERVSTGAVMQGIVIDESRSPIVVVELNKQLDDDGWRSYLATLTAYVDRRQPFAVVIVTNDSQLTARQRAATAELVKAREDDLRTYCKGNAAVVKGAVQRGVITALSWLVKFPFPSKVFSNLDDAIGWARSQLGAH
jgi:hypothetical protein